MLGISRVKLPRRAHSRGTVGTERQPELRISRRLADATSLTLIVDRTRHDQPEIWDRWWWNITTDRDHPEGW